MVHAVVQPRVGDAGLRRRRGSSSAQAKSRMERLARPRHGREGRRLSERKVSESNPVASRSVAPQDSSTTLRSARNDRTNMKLVIAATGASGAIYLQRLLQQIDCASHEVHLVMSAYAR